MQQYSECTALKELDPGIKPTFPAFSGRFFTFESRGSPVLEFSYLYTCIYSFSNSFRI